MKKPLSIALAASLILSVMALPTFAADATSGASVVAPATSTSAPAPKAPSGQNVTIDTSKLEAGAYYTVVSGDTFSGIAWKYNMSIDALAKLNPHIKDINWIYVGDKVILKAAAPAPAPAPAPAAPATPAVDKAPYEAAEKEGFPWETKREEGYNYDMTHKISKGAADNLSKKEWFEQLDFYEKFFTGKTVAEVEDWFKKYTDVNGRPFKMAYLNDAKISAADKTAAEAASASFTEEEKKMLVDVTTGATMSLQDGHSRFMESLQEAWAAKKVVAGNENLYLGIGNVANYRVSKSNLNVTTASILFNKDGKIVDLEWDVLEITPTMFQWLPVQK